MPPLEFLRLLTLFTTFFCVLAENPCELSNCQLKKWIGPLRVSGNTRPLLQETVMTNVNVSLTVEKMTILDPTSMVIEYQLAMTQKWQDHRLAPDYKTRKLATMSAIWQPKITFAKGDAVLVKDSTQFWRGSTNGSVIYSESYSVKSDCSQDMKRYPFDTQNCIIKISSYRFTAEEVNLKWDKDEAVVTKDTRGSGSFKLIKAMKKEDIDFRNSGNFSVLIVEFLISRNSLQIVLTSILPSTLLVTISYLTFWLEGSAIHSRIVLCIFAMAGLLYLEALTSYTVICMDCVKALDIWFAICTIFTLLPLLESIAVNILKKKSSLIKEDITLEFQIEKGLETYVNWTDKILRLLHPIGFLSCQFLLYVARS